MKKYTVNDINDILKTTYNKPLQNSLNPKRKLTLSNGKTVQMDEQKWIDNGCMYLHFIALNGCIKLANEDYSSIIPFRFNDTVDSINPEKAFSQNYSNKWHEYLRELVNEEIFAFNYENNDKYQCLTKEDVFLMGEMYRIDVVKDNENYKVYNISALFNDFVIHEEICENQNMQNVFDVMCYLTDGKRRVDFPWKDPNDREYSRFFDGKKPLNFKNMDAQNIRAVTGISQVSASNDFTRSSFNAFIEFESDGVTYVVDLSEELVCPADLYYQMVSFEKFDEIPLELFKKDIKTLEDHSDEMSHYAYYMLARDDTMAILTNSDKPERF